MYKILILSLTLIALFNVGAKANDDDDDDDKCEPTYTPQIKKITVTIHDKEYVEGEGKVIESDKEANKLELLMNLKKALPDSAVATMTIYSDKTGEFKPESEDKDMEFCDFLNKYSTYINDIATYGDFPISCPIDVKKYKVTLYAIGPCLFGVSVPSANFKLDVSLKDDKNHDPIINIVLDVSFIPKL